MREIRATLVEKQVELSDLQDGSLFLLVDAVTLGIRQFLTYQELLNRSDDAPRHPRFGGFYRPEDVRQSHFDALEVLRGHLSRCLGQVAANGGMDLPQEGLVKSYQDGWQLEAYESALI
ncbi:MAG: hypothetical protein COB40_06910 [Marinosulfonomonas sp.]|nr:MAG: hypothetical protein COB40_06910 [Marinosulfonomonas sp.]